MDTLIDHVAVCARRELSASDRKFLRLGFRRAFFNAEFWLTHDAAKSTFADVSEAVGRILGTLNDLNDCLQTFWKCDANAVPSRAVYQLLLRDDNSGSLHLDDQKKIREIKATIQRMIRRAETITGSTQFSADELPDGYCEQERHSPWRTLVWYVEQALQRRKLQVGMTKDSPNGFWLNLRDLYWAVRTKADERFKDYPDDALSRSIEISRDRTHGAIASTSHHSEFCRREVTDWLTVQEVKRAVRKKEAIRHDARKKRLGHQAR